VSGPPSEGRRRDRFVPALLVALVLLVPVVYPHAFVVALLVFVGIYTIVCAGLSLIFGYAGQLSLTQAAFYGIGAYISALLTTRFEQSFWVGLTAAALLPALVAAAIGLPILRLRHYYLAMATLAFGEIMVVVFVQEVDITGGPTGIVNLPGPSLFGYRLDTPARYYYLVWALAVLVLWFSHNLVRGKYGRALRAINENEVAAGAMGVNVAALKALMFVLSAVYAGLGGALFAHHISFVSPDTFSVNLSILLVIMVAVGGVQSLWGAVLGAVFITVLPSLLGGYQQYAMLVYGFVLFFVLMFMPDGLVGLFDRLAARMRPRPTAPAEPAR
jgi:branched-chain amino acid transport system permease protein